MSVQVCEGVFRQKCGRYVAVIPCERREGGQRWTDGVVCYSDNGIVTVFEGGCAVDLVEYIGPFPQPDQTAKIDLMRTTLTQQTAEIDRLRAELQQTQAWRTAATDAHSQSEAQRIEQTAEVERLQAEIERLKNKWLTEFTATQQLRSEVAQLNRLLGEERDNLLYLRVDHTALEHHCEGMKAAFLAVIKRFVEARS